MGTRVPCGKHGPWAPRNGASTGRGLDEKASRDENLLLECGWFFENAGNRTHAVGLKLANGWG